VKVSSNPLIVGAGLSGLIAAHIFPGAQVIERNAQPGSGHKALLRFRSSAVAQATGIEFKKVTVRKAIHVDDQFVSASPRWANLYAQKCVGDIAARSIWNLEPVERWIAPEDFYDRLVENVGTRLIWGVATDFGDDPAGQALISTAPLEVAARALGIVTEESFARARITVVRVKLQGVNVHQTIYFPGHETPIYRASITGNVLIIEMVIGDPSTERCKEAIGHAEGAFGIYSRTIMESMEVVQQEYGKIVPIDEEVRRQLIVRLTLDHGIFSLGRFATWRNILLDDVVNDARVIKRLISAGAYGNVLHNANKTWW